MSLVRSPFRCLPDVGLLVPSSRTLLTLRWAISCRSLLTLLGEELSLTCRRVVVLLIRLTVPLGSRWFETHWPERAVVVISVLLLTAIPRRVLQCRPRLCRTVTALLMSGLFMNIRRKWCLNVGLPLTPLWHLLSAAVLTRCSLLWVSTGPNTPLVLTEFLVVFVLMTARTLLTKATTRLLVPPTLPRMSPRCLLNLLWHPELVITEFRLRETSPPFRSAAGMLFVMTCRVRFLMMVAPFMFGLLTSIGPPPA